MPKATTALAAAVGAAAGAAAATAYHHYSSLSSLSLSRSPAPAPAPAQPADVDPSGLFQYGFPGPVADVRSAVSLVSCFDRRTRNPAWVAEHMTAASLAQRRGDRRHSTFSEDAGIPAAFRARLADYFRSGYDRGHQVPAADARWSQAAVDATFALSNMCPQVGDGFNRDYWAHLEDFCRRLTAVYPSVRVVTGPLYLPRRDPADGKWRVSYEVIGSPPNVAVPTHFFKIVLAEGAPALPAADGRPPNQPPAADSVALAAFVLPNAAIANDRPLADFEAPLEAVERAAGLEFAAALPPPRRRRLCSELHCSILLKDYRERQKALTAA